MAMFSCSPANSKKMAIKLHKQFAHPSADRLIRLLRDAKRSSVEIENEIKIASKNCDVCCRLQKPRPRPVVSMPLSDKFNGTIAMDLKYWNKDRYFLVMVDVATRFCSAAVISDKRPCTILKMLFIHWISKFGAPRQILTDNGREFNNEEMRQFGESFNVKILTTSAESPWSNGLCERLNGILGQMVTKISTESSCDVHIALSWAVSAQNAMSNFSGFSPNQLVFGMNPAIPDIFNSEPPALENPTASEIVRQNLNALHSARKEFVKIESNERVRRALRSNIRSSPIEDLKNGDGVYFKRNGSNEWKGPGTVIGKDGKQVLVKHGGTYVRVHICRLVRPPNDVISDEKEYNMQDSANVTPIHNEPHGVKEVKNSVGDMEECVHNEWGVSNEVASHIEEEDSPTSDEEFQDSHTGQEPVLNENAASMEENVLNKPLCYKVGDRIRGIDSESGQYISGKIQSRAGKATGSFKNCFNVKLDTNGSVQWFDLQKLESLTKIPDEVESAVLYNSDEVGKAKESEIQNWISNDVFEEVEDHGQSALTVRWVITEKIKENRTLTKARLVVRGFQENSASIQKDSPTCSRESLRIAMTLASVNNWDVQSMDIKSAYLQGQPISREVFIRPPSEYDEGKLWKLKKTVYGLCDAARAWYSTVKSELLSLGMTMCKLDPSLFYMINEEKLAGIICIHVDDFFWCGNEHFSKNVIDKLSHLFIIGSSGVSNFKYLGLNVQCSSKGIIVDQNDYAASLQEIPISQFRACNKSKELTEKEKEEYRALIGQLNWLSIQTRPDIAFETCELHVLLKNGTISEVVRLNKLIDRVKRSNLSINFPKMGSIDACHLEAYCDASYANVQNGKSQGGFIIFVVNPEGEKCPIFWQSRAIRRVVKSTLAAETLALVECAETSAYIAMILQELTSVKLEIVCKVDNKSLVQAIYSSKGVDDRRLRVDIAVIKDMLDRNELNEVSWIPTKLQVADPLTKRGACTTQLCAALRHD